MRIITDKTKNEIGKRLSAIYYIALHGYGKDTASDLASTEKIIEHLYEIADKVGGERFSKIEMPAYVLKLQRAIQQEKIQREKEVKKMPKEQTQPKTGTAKWIISSDGYYPYCSACKREPKDGEMTDYCPHCGARMELE